MGSARRRHLAVGVVGIWLGLAAVSTGGSPQEPSPPHDAFEAADLDFRAFYGAARAATREGFGPVILVDMDSLILVRGDEREEAKVIPPMYHRMKSLSHVPLAIYVALAPHGDGPIPAERLEALRGFRGRLDELNASIDGSGLEPAQVERAHRLLDRSRAFLDGVIAAGRNDPAQLESLTRGLAPIVLANAADAARAQIDAYHEQMTTWRKEIAPDDWKRLRVVVMGPQMPHRHNLAVQYFAKLMGQEGESRRLVYAEMLDGQRQALDLLATHQLDSELSDAFFADPDRMDYDLLGNAASVYLDSLDLGPH